MSIFKTRAVVIKTGDINENDKLVWLFSEKLGKISCIAKGAKKSKSKFLPISQQLCFGNYVLFKGKSLYSINEVEIIDSFGGLLSDLESITYASYLCELIDICLVEEESNRELFKNFAISLYLMKNKVVDLETLARAFELKVLAATGYNFNFEHCSACRKKINTANYIDLHYLGGICKDCTKTGGLYISFTAYNALKFLSKIPIENSYRINLSKETKEELYKILSFIISQNYFKKPKSLETLNFLNKLSYIKEENKEE